MCDYEYDGHSSRCLWLSTHPHRTDHWVSEACIVIGGNCWCKKVSRVDSLVMQGRVMLGKIVGPVCIARLPENMEVALAFAITEPVKTHVHSLGAFLFDRVIDYPTGGVVICLQRCGQLRVTKFVQSSVDWAESLGIEEQST